ncbi:MAG: dihydropteroate synthase [Candidatus Omnitrophota bacterium]
MRILQVDNLNRLTQIMRDIHVDPYGIKIMRLKGIMHLIKLNSIPNIAANILKQEMLSLGGDVAVSRDSLIGKNKKTDCLVMGNLSQINRLNHKLNRQPFGLSRLGLDISQAIENYQKDNLTLELGRYRLNLKRRTHIMGIINLTPDSFSGDGLCPSSVVHRPSSIEKIIEFVEKMINDGADIIDVGGESSRPGASTVSLKEELARTIPVIKQLVKRIKVPISIDTYKPEVAKAALDNGAVMVNDISGLRNPAMVKLVAREKSGIVIMHSKGSPKNMQNNPKYKSVIDEIIKYLGNAIIRARDAGINREKIIIDPGIGFAKNIEHNGQILKNLKEFKVLGQPILIGASRKSFIGSILNAGVNDRLAGTISTCILAAKNGANFLRVHDVGMVKQAIKVFDTVNNA